MINHGKNKNVLAGNFQKTIRFAAGLFDRVEYKIWPHTKKCENVSQLTPVRRQF